MAVRVVTGGAIATLALFGCAGLGYVAWTHIPGPPTAGPDVSLADPGEGEAVQQPVPVVKPPPAEVKPAPCDRKSGWPSTRGWPT